MIRVSVQFRVVLFLFIWITATHGSYLGYPRINFAGFFRADTDTRNNNPCNYHKDYNPKCTDFNADWGFNGTNEFELFENVVTMAFDKDGKEAKDDPVIGKHIVSNYERPHAKLVDLDVDCQIRSTIYGMKFGITDDLDSSPEDAKHYFNGTWTPAVIAQDMWTRIACYDKDDKQHGEQLYQDSFPFGVMSTTTIDNIFWNSDLGGSSSVLQQLKDAAEASDAEGKLAVRIALSYYTRNLPSYVPYNATLGYVIGTIGVPSPHDTLNVGGQRVMHPVQYRIPEFYKPVVENFCYDSTLLKSQTWVSKAPFEVDEDKREVRVDFSNAFTVDMSNTLIDIGKLYLAIQDTSTIDEACVQPLKNGNDIYYEIPYLDESWIKRSSGIFRVSLTDKELVSLQSNYALLVVQLSNTTAHKINATKVCEEADFLSIPTTPHMAYVLAKEPEYYIRPKGYYVDRLSTDDTSDMTFYVTHYGNPAHRGYIRLQLESGDQTAITYTPEIQSIDAHGLAKFTFTAVQAPPFPREYDEPPCKMYDNSLTLPLDGNVFLFNYMFCSSKIDCQDKVAEKDYALTFLYYSDFTPDERPDWVHDVGPILSQFAQVTPIMRKILDMSDYNEVTAPHNKQLMILSLNRPFDDPGYMPATRNLSPARHKMIMAWLNEDKPLYDRDGTNVKSKHDECQPPKPLILYSSTCTYSPRCRISETIALDGQIHPSYFEPYYKELVDPKKNPALLKTEIGGKTNNINPKRPLMGFSQYLKDKNEGKLELNEAADGVAETNKCSSLDEGVKGIKEQLQTALSLEFATIPVYLTTLYSIADGCNREIYDRIRSVAMQEMAHFAQVANILIAVGGNPVIDDSSFVLSYPSVLPGDVLPGLKVSLKKLSLQHVKHVLMGIEVPLETSVGGSLASTHTIGALYEEIKACISEIHNMTGKDPFSDPRPERQVEWPWKLSDEKLEQPVSVKIIRNINDALHAIDFIVEQGEGTNAYDPTVSPDSEELSHFFKFEEIVCERELVKINKDKNKYAYIGKPIPFNPAGVWNMRDNPKSKNIQPHTNCYTEAKVFHQVFRNLLRSLHALFNPSGDEQQIKVKDTILLMESLQVHGKKTMWTKFKPDSLFMCGPVWEYYWEDYEGANVH